MNQLKIYPDWYKAHFLSRPNRFVMNLEYNSKKIEAYVPNTGRMHEFLVPGQVFYLTSISTPKFNYKVIGTEYQDNYVFLDTIRINSIFKSLLEKNILDQFDGISDLRREVKYKNSRIDFATFKDGRINCFFEIKSCTLCHNGIAMFPDAPTVRGRKHIEILETATAESIESHMVYLITNSSSKKFIPNYHTDYEYGKTFLKSSKINFHAFSLRFRDPVTIDLDDVRAVEIDKIHLQQHCQNSGSYILLLHNPTEIQLEIGKLSIRRFKKGFYAYIGSAMRVLDKRIKRHYSKKKKKHWHIDYITPDPMILKKTILIRSKNREEEALAEALEVTADSIFPCFGSSDSSRKSHLFYFKDNPLKTPGFNNIVLDFMTGTVKYEKDL